MLKTPFAHDTDTGYNIFDDWPLIEASFAQQYGIRLRQTDMKWLEFCALLAGLGPDTPFGATVQTRTETDPERLKNFTPEMKRVRNEWVKKRIAKKMEKDPTFAQRETEALQDAFRKAFG